MCYILLILKTLKNFIKQLFSRRRSEFLKHKESARQIIHQSLAHFAPLCEVKYQRVSIRNQKSRWGSCSARGNLNFNYRLIFLPAELRDYVIVHELCHLKQMNHSQSFWNEVAKVLPDYQERIKKLKIIEKNRHSMSLTSEVVNKQADLKEKLISEIN